LVSTYAGVRFGDSSSRALSRVFHLIGDVVGIFLWEGFLQLLFENEILSMDKMHV